MLIFIELVPYTHVKTKKLSFLAKYIAQKLCQGFDDHKGDIISPVNRRELHQSMQVHFKGLLILQMSLAGWGLELRSPTGGALGFIPGKQTDQPVGPSLPKLNGCDSNDKISKFAC